MSRLRELVEELCPDGVEYKLVGNCITSLRTGLNPRKNFVLNTEDATNYYITVRELDGLNVVPSEKTDLVNDDALQLIDNRSHLMAGDILFSGVGTVGHTAFIEDKPRNWNIKEGVYAITVDASVLDPKYMFWFLRSTVARSQFMRGTDGGTVSSLSMASFKNLRIPVPPIEVQREIVRILDSFQEFDDVLTAEIEAREKQLQASIDKMIGMTDGSTDRETVPLDSLCKSIFDGDHQAPPQSSEGIPFIVIANFNKGVIDFSDTKYVNEDYYKAIKQVRKPERGDVILSVTGSYGISALVDTDRPFCFQRHVAILKPRCDSQFLLALLRSGYAQRFFDMNVTGAVQKQIPLTALRRMPVPDFDEEHQLAVARKAFEMSCLVGMLHAERDARRKQFEYYRDKLLSFPVKEA